MVPQKSTLVESPSARVRYDVPLDLCVLTIEHSLTELICESALSLCAT